LVLRIGKINFLNLYPIFYTLEKECDSSLYEFVEGSPSEVNRLLRKGAVHISPSSSIEYLRHPGNYTLIRGHSISARGPVRSILLFSRVPLEELDGGTILATGMSETSTALLRIITRRFYGIEAEISVSAVPPEEGLKVSPAYMLIGDEALRARMSPAVGGSMPHVYDLSLIWYERTGLPFVFALWIGKKECCGRDAFAEFVSRLDSAREYARSHLDEIARTCPRRDIMSPDDLISYWRGISYDLDDENMKGLELFRDYLAEEGLI